MRNNKLNYVAVGAFVLLMVTGLVTTLTVLSGRSGPSDAYYTSYEDATGLKFGSVVLYMGYPVGQVERIAPELVEGQLRFRIDLSIGEAFRGWNVPVDSVAQIKTSGLLAATTIDIRAGQSKTRLKPGDRIRGLGKTDVFSAVSATANTIKELTENNIKPLVVTLNKSVQLLGRAIEEDGAPLLSNLNRIAEQVADRGPDIIDNFVSTAVALRATSESLRQILSAENVGRVDLVMTNWVNTSDNIVKLSDDARTYLKELAGPAVSLRRLAWQSPTRSKRAKPLKG